MQVASCLFLRHQTRQDLSVFLLRCLWSTSVKDPKGSSNVRRVPSNWALVRMVTLKLCNPGMRCGSEGPLDAASRKEGGDVEEGISESSPVHVREELSVKIKAKKKKENEIWGDKCHYIGTLRPKLQMSGSRDFWGLYDWRLNYWYDDPRPLEKRPYSQVLGE